MSQKIRPEPSGIFDALFHLLQEAIGDIRDKVVEQGWFGRPVNGPAPNPDIAPSVGAEGSPWEPRQPSFDETWAARTQDIAAAPLDRGEPGGMEL